MAQTEWDALKELKKVQARMNSLFENALARTNFDADGSVGAWMPVADVCESDECLTVSLELPGVEQADIEVRVVGDDLVVEGERRMGRETSEGEQFHRVERSYGPFSRRFPLASTLDRDSVAATYENGVLTVTIVKKSGKHPGPIRVSIR
jgi:HSP20 family protein